MDNDELLAEDGERGSLHASESVSSQDALLKRIEELEARLASLAAGPSDSSRLAASSTNTAGGPDTGERALAPPPWKSRAPVVEVAGPWNCAEVFSRLGIAIQTDDQTAVRPEPEGDAGLPGSSLPAAQGRQVARKKPRRRLRRKRRPSPDAQLNRAALVAMRELANLTSQSAVLEHSRRRLKSSAMARLVLALSALFCSVLLSAIWFFLGAGDLAYYGSAVALLAAVVWTAQSIMLYGQSLWRRFALRRLARQARRDSRPSLAPEAKQPAHQP